MRQIRFDGNITQVIGMTWQLYTGVAEDSSDSTTIKMCEAIPGQVFRGNKPKPIIQQEQQQMQEAELETKEAPPPPPPPAVVLPVAHPILQVPAAQPVLQVPSWSLEIWTRGFIWLSVVWWWKCAATSKTRKRG